MIRRRQWIHAVFLVLAPLIVAVFGFGVAGAAFLVLLLLAWRWLIVLSGIVKPEEGPELVLEATAISHFVEKVRWCMDRLGLEYTEERAAGTLGVFFTGRTVPKLRIRTGLVESTIGNSPEILRYLWGAYGHGGSGNGRFLEPTSERLELETALDRYGRNLQIWGFQTLLDDRDLALRIWGVDSPDVPHWQRMALKLVYPILAFLMRQSFRLSDERRAKAVMHIEDLLSDIDTRLADGRRSILGDDEINYTDIQFAALSSLWMQPPEFAAGKSESVRVPREQAPLKMRNDAGRWLEDFPRATAFIERLYQEER